MTDKKSNIVLTVSTAVFAVLSLCLIFTYKANKDFLDTHGRIGTLAQSEQESLLQENEKAYSYKRNISITVNDENNEKLVLPLLSKISTEDINVREEFIGKKLVITLKNAIENVENGVMVTTDSNVMGAVGLYKQDSDVVLEIYELDNYGYQIELCDDSLTVSFKNIDELYDKKIVIYIPYEDKDRLYSEEWTNELNSVIGDKNKIYLASAQKDEYSEEGMLEFADEIDADLIIGIDFADTSEPEYMEVIYNDKYFIPYFGSPQLAVLMRQELEEKTGLYVTAYKECNEENILVKKAKVPAAMAKIYVQMDEEGIEEKYTLDHNVMEGISEIIKNIQNQEEIK